MVSGARCGAILDVLRRRLAAACRFCEQTASRTLWRAAYCPRREARGDGSIAAYITWFGAPRPSPAQPHDLPGDLVIGWDTAVDGPEARRHGREPQQGAEDVDDVGGHVDPAVAVDIQAP